MLKIELGLMKAGKSKSCITSYNAYKGSSTLRVGAFTYKPNTTEAIVEITTRDTSLQPIQALNLMEYPDFMVTKLMKSYDIIFIDEIQFAPKSHIEIIVKESEYRIINCYGLYLDYLSEEFESVAFLRENAWLVLGKNNYRETFLSADCDICSNEAKHNIRVTDETELFVTAKDVYKTVCDECKRKIEG